MDETDVTRSTEQGLWQRTNQYLEIGHSEGVIYNQIGQNVRKKTEEVLYQVYHATGYYRHFDGHIYYSLYDASGVWQGYVAEELVNHVSSTQGRWHSENLTVKVTSRNYDVYRNFDWQKKASGSSVLGKIFNVRGFYKPTDGQTYYSIYDNQGHWQGYLDARAVTETTEGQGPWRAKKAYISIVNTEAKLYQGFDWKVRQQASQIENETLMVNGYYQHINGQTYYSIYNEAGAWQGYLDKKETKELPPQGKYYSDKQTVMVRNDSVSLWRNFNWQLKTKGSQLRNERLEVRGYYQHINGSKYYTVYDRKGMWQGYVNATNVKKANEEGPWLTKKAYIKLKRSEAQFYRGFDWTIKQTAQNLMGQELVVNGYYQHINGHNYYSVYDKNKVWQGYLNAADAILTSGQGPYHATNQYVTITKGGYKIWQNFDWKEKNTTNKVLETTYQVKGYYDHINGERYYSLYDGKGNWQGYLNATGATVASGPQGTWLSDYRQVTVNKRGYTFYQGFDWQVRGTSDNKVNQTFQLRGRYHHLNGSVYYSLYDGKGNWQGYVNSGATAPTRSVSSFMGVSRANLVQDLKNHEHDRFYIGTPYKSLTTSVNPNSSQFMSPNGAPNYFGPGFNCTGFVAYVVRKAGGDLNRITQTANAYGGVTNVYNWRDALKTHTNYKTYSSVNALLSSGQAKKGDLIYFEPDYSKPVYDGHIGVFWGNTGRENKIYHTVYPSTKISQLYAYYGYSKVYLFSLD